MKKTPGKTVILVHGRHLLAKDWEKLVWGDGEQIGTAPLGLYLASIYNGSLIFGTGASMKDGLMECVYTLTYLREHISSLTQFPEFRSNDLEEERVGYEALLDTAVLDRDSQNTEQEIRNAIDYCKRIGATTLIEVTSPAHAARCANTVARLLEAQHDFGGVLPIIVSTRSSGDKYRAANTVVFEYPHRGDDPSPTYTDILPLIFKIPQIQKQKFKDELTTLLAKYTSEKT